MDSIYEARNRNNPREATQTETPTPRRKPRRQATETETPTRRRQPVRQSSEPSTHQLMVQGRLLSLYAEIAYDRRWSATADQLRELARAVAATVTSEHQDLTADVIEGVVYSWAEVDWDDNEGVCRLAQRVAQDEMR